MGDNDFKYIMQDTGNIFIGVRYQFQELLANKDLNFKFRSIIEHYLMKEIEPETTLESELYYMSEESFVCRTLMQLKARVKVSILTEKKTLFGKKSVSYAEQIIKVTDFVKMTPEEKEKNGVMIQELSISKLALMSFSI